MNKKGLLIVISGPSGVGKGTVLAEYRKNRENLHMSVSATTRSPRPGEEEGREYFFLTREEFQAEIDRGNMLEYAVYGDNCYGTPKKAVEDQLRLGYDVVLEIEVQGAMQVKEKCPEAVLIFILPPSFEELRNRLVGRRTESEEAVNKRMNAAERELLSAGEYDYVIVNDNVEKAAERLNFVIEGARCQSVLNRELLEKIARSIEERK